MKFWTTKQRHRKEDVNDQDGVDVGSVGGDSAIAMNRIKKIAYFPNNNNNNNKNKNDNVKKNSSISLSNTSSIMNGSRRANITSKREINRLLAIFPRLRDFSKIKISLWLIPPAGEVTHMIQQEIESLARMQDTPTFSPHITLVGGIEVNHREIVRIIMSLKKELSGFGAVPCKFDRVQGIVAAYKDDEKKICHWNQSTVAILNREEKLIEAIKIARKILLNENHDVDIISMTHFFTAPTCEPHLSLAYAHQFLGSCIVNKDVPPDFEAKEVALWRTDPSSLEGVKKWYQIECFSLC